MSTRRTRFLSPLLDGLAVLAGVLLAFSVESYGQAREDLERADRMLTALDGELEVNATQLDRRLEAHEAELRAIDSLFRAVVLPAPGVGPSVTEVTALIERVGPRVIEPYQTGALDDLMLSGGLILVEDQRVRQGVLDYARMLELETAAQENGVDFWNDHLSPYYFEYGNLGQFLAADALGLEAPPPVLGAFVRSRQFANLLGERRAIENRLRSARVRLRAQIDSVRPLLR